MAEKRFHKSYARKAKTDYGKRLQLLSSGMSRLVVRISTKNIVVQLVDYSPQGDVIKFAASTKALEKVGWKGSNTNLPAAYLIGLLVGKKASGTVKEAILDLGKRHSVLKSRIYAVVKGAIDGGLAVRADEAALPDEERINGQHISAYAANLQKENADAYNKLFSAYLKKQLKPESLPDHFNEVKSKIAGAK